MAGSARVTSRGPYDRGNDARLTRRFEYDRALGALTGLAIGDALGMPTQCLSRAQIEARYGVLGGFEPAPPEQEIARGMPAARVTDDTDQAVLLAQALLDGGGRVEARAFGEALLAWHERMERAGSLDLLGPSTLRAVRALADGADPTSTGRWGETNGAAMRIVPVGIVTPPEPLGALVAAVHDACRLTHDTSVAIAGAAAVAAAVSAGISGATLGEALDHGIAAARLGERRGHYAPAPSLSARLTWAIQQVAGLRGAALLTEIHDLVGTSMATQESVPATFALLSSMVRVAAPQSDGATPSGGATQSGGAIPSDGTMQSSGVTQSDGAPRPNDGERPGRVAAGSDAAPAGAAISDGTHTPDGVPAASAMLQPGRAARPGDTEAPDDVRHAALPTTNPDDSWAWHTCLLAASLGGDCDTIAAMAGAIAGAVAGAEAFPPSAIAQLTAANPTLDLPDLARALLALRPGHPR